MEKLIISIIIPCFNEEEVLHETYKRLKEMIKSSDYEFEIIFVNDGSEDKTFDILKSFSNIDKEVKIVNFSRNFGHQPAVSAGLKNCIGDMAAIIDADLQDPPELIPEMIKLMLSEKCAVVYGVRKVRKGENIFKKITAKIYYRLLNSLSDTNLPLDTGDFRLINKKVITEFNKLNEKNKYIRGIISWIGYRQVPIFYDREKRFAGETHYTFFKMIKFALTGLTYFTKKPLKLALNVGFVSVLLGIILTLFVFYAKLIDKTTIPGWASTLIIIIFFGGIQMFTIGVLGEYIGSIFDEVKNRPEYIIDQKINLSDQKGE